MDVFGMMSQYKKSLQFQPQMAYTMYLLDNMVSYQPLLYLTLLDNKTKIKLDAWVPFFSLQVTIQVALLKTSESNSMPRMVVQLLKLLPILYLKKVKLFQRFIKPTSHKSISQKFKKLNGNWKMVKPSKSL